MNSKHYPRIFPARRLWPDAVEDIGEVKRDVTRLRLVNKADGFRRLPDLKLLKELWCFDVDKERLNSICDCCSLQALHIENLKTAELSNIQRLEELKILSLNRCSKVESLELFGPLQNLDGLAITGFKNVHRLDELSLLTNLQELSIEGSMWTRMSVGTLMPLRSLRNLRYLGLANLAVKDQSLSPLSELQQLEELNIANFYPMEEFARLSASLKNTHCDWFQAYIETPLFCKKCHEKTQVMLTGKRSRTLCRNCDVAQLNKHSEKFQEAATNAQTTSN